MGQQSLNKWLMTSFNLRLRFLKMMSLWKLWRTLLLETDIVKIIIQKQIRKRIPWYTIKLEICILIYVHYISLNVITYNVIIQLMRLNRPRLASLKLLFFMGCIEFICIGTVTILSRWHVRLKFVWQFKNRSFQVLV